MELDQLINLAKAERLEYDCDPLLFMLKQTIADLSQIQKYSNNIKLYLITNALPTLIDIIPAFLQIDNNINNRIEERLFFFTNDNVCNFCIKLDQYYVYIDYYQTDSGFSCCQKLSIYFTTNLQLLLVHIPIKLLPDKYKI